MPRRHGRAARMWIAGNRVSPDAGSFTIGRMAEAAQVTSLEENDHVYVPGVRQNNVQISGYYNDDAARVDEILASTVGLSNDNGDADTLVIFANAQGASGFAAAASIEDNYQITGPRDGPVTVSANMIVSGFASRVLVASAYATVSTAGTVAASLQLAGGTASGTATQGAVAYLQCDSISGTVRVEVYHGTANLHFGTPFGTATFTAAGGKAGTAFELTSAVGPYITTRWSLPGGTGTAAFVAAVGPRYH